MIAVDGPGGVGKSTVSRRVAQRLGLDHLDTGAFYRAATLAVLEAGVDPSDADDVAGIVEEVSIDHRQGRTYLGGRDVSAEIRGADVTAAVSVVAAHPGVRRSMVAAQRRWVDRRGGEAVVEGRDIGTVVFPDAVIKVFLDADPEVRAVRRSREVGSAPAEVAAALRARDRLDISRADSPLRAAPEAVVIDTSDLSIEAVVDRIVALGS